MQKTREWISVAQVAERRGVDRRTVHRWVESGRLKPVHRMPGKTGAMLFDLEDVDAIEVQS